MVWEWGHAQEAYDDAKQNLYRRSMVWLAEVYAEWKSHFILEAERSFRERLGEIEIDLPDGVGIEIPEELTTSPYEDGRHDKARQWALDNLASDYVERDDVVEQIWEWASNNALCDNGGYRAWMCPDGCHTVPFDLEESEEEEAMNEMGEE